MHKKTWDCWNLHCCRTQPFTNCLGKCILQLKCINSGYDWLTWCTLSLGTASLCSSKLSHYKSLLLLCWPPDRFSYMHTCSCHTCKFFLLYIYMQVCKSTICSLSFNILTSQFTFMNSFADSCINNTKESLWSDEFPSQCLVLLCCHLLLTLRKTMKAK